MCAGTDALSPAPSCVGADRAAVGSAAPGVCPAPSCVGADRAAVGSAAPSCKAALAVGSPAPGVCPAPSCAQPAQAASRHSSSNIAMGLMKFPSSFSVVSYPLGQHFSLRTIIGIPPFPYDAARRAGPVGAAAPRARDVQTKQTMRPPGAGRAGGWRAFPANGKPGMGNGTCVQREQSVRKTCARRRRPARVRARTAAVSMIHYRTNW